MLLPATLRRAKRFRRCFSSYFHETPPMGAKGMTAKLLELRPGNLHVLKLPIGTSAELRPGKVLRIEGRDRAAYVAAVRSPLAFVLPFEPSKGDLEVGAELQLEIHEDDQLRVGDIADVLHVNADGEACEGNFSGTPLGWELAPRPGATGQVSQRRRSFIMLPAFGPVPEQKQLGTIRHNYHCGIPGVDALAPIGRGQNMLIIGKPFNGLCEATGILLHPEQKEENERHVKVIYAAVSDTARNAINEYNMDSFKDAVRDVYIVRPKEERVRLRIEQARREKLSDQASIRRKADDPPQDRYRKHRAKFGNMRHPIGGQHLIPEGFRPSEMYIDTFRETFNLGENTEGTRAEAMCVCHAALAVGEEFRRNGHEAVVIIDDLELARTFWDDQEQAMQRLLYPEAEKETTTAPRVTNTDDGEMRAYYSSLLHRVGKFNEDHGGGSLTCVALLHDRDIAGGDLAGLNQGLVPSRHDAEGNNGTTYSIEDFAGEAYSNKVRERLSALLARKDIPLTEATLKKINIPPPSKPEALTQNRKLIQSLMSLSDGQIVINADMYLRGYYIPVDAKESLTRIGIGANIDAKAVAPVVAAFTKGLRLALAQDFAKVPADPATSDSPEQKRLNAFRMLLFSPLPFLMGQFAVSRRLLVLLFACAEMGVFDDIGTRWVKAKAKEDAQMDKDGSHDGEAIEEALSDFACPVVDALYDKAWRTSSIGAALEAAAIARCVDHAFPPWMLSFEDGGDFLVQEDRQSLRDKVEQWLSESGDERYASIIATLEGTWSTVTPEVRGPGGGRYNALGDELIEDMFEDQERT